MYHVTNNAGRRSHLIAKLRREIQTLKLWGIKKQITSSEEIPPIVVLRVKTTLISICQAAYDYSINYRTLPRYVHHIADADVN